MMKTIFALLFFCSMHASTMKLDSKIYVAGHSGLVGSSVIRALKSKGYSNIITASSKDLDLRLQENVEAFFERNRPEYVILAAAKVGGIKANEDFPAEFIYDNLAISTNVIHSSYKSGVKKLIFLGSSCIYPRNCPQPIKEEYLLSGYLEKTNEPYAIAKIAGMKLCEYYNKQYGTKFISCMPTNLYGPNDNFDLKTSHVLPALIRKFIEAKNNCDKQVVIWGSGSPRREFLHVDDLADSIIFMMNHYDGDQFVNVGTGIDLSIKELAELIAQAVSYEGELVFDTSKPDGTPRKLLNVDRLKDCGWSAKISLKDGITKTVEWYINSIR